MEETGTLSGKVIPEVKLKKRRDWKRRKTAEKIAQLLSSLNSWAISRKFEKFTEEAGK